MKKNGTLEESFRELTRAQAQLVQAQAQSQLALTQLAVATDARFMRIEERFDRIERLLQEHHDMLKALPEAIRQKIGFDPRRKDEMRPLIERGHPRMGKPGWITEQLYRRLVEGRDQ